MIAGIDLGTTHSLIGIVDAGFPILLADESGSRLTPSAVYFPPHAPPEVGSPALRRRLLEPQRTVLSIKRLMGRRPGEEPQNLPYQLRSHHNGEGLAVEIDGILRTPIEISALILTHLKSIAEKAAGEKIDKAVITVPAYFNDAQRLATRQAGELAGFSVERILNEPTAAALAYGLDKLGEKSKIAVFDLGGGTFDLSILELNEGIFQVLATQGDTELGGDDLDRAVAEWITREAFPANQPPPEAAARILDAALTAKVALSHQLEHEISLPFLSGVRHFHRTLSRQEFEKLARPIIERTRKHCLQAMADAKLKAADLDRVLLVGGSTRTPLVRELARDIFGREPDTSQHPDEAIALGAVIQAGMLSGALQKLTLLDVTPLSLGIETFGGLMNVILPRNTTIPAKAGEMFTNAAPGQTAMLIRVLQGEREMARDNWELGQFTIDFPPAARGSARVGVQFSIDSDGILQVLTRDTRTNHDRILEIKHSAVKVDDERVEKMISESVEHAFGDVAERQWTEAKMKAEELLGAVDTALQQAGEFIDAEDAQAISSASALVRNALGSGELAQLKSANHSLDDATQSLAATLVEKAMEAAMKRKGIL